MAVTSSLDLEAAVGGRFVLSKEEVGEQKGGGAPLTPGPLPPVCGRGGAALAPRCMGCRMSKTRGRKGNPPH
jgi:hypothetical protein